MTVDASDRDSTDSGSVAQTPTSTTAAAVLTFGPVSMALLAHHRVINEQMVDLITMAQTENAIVVELLRVMRRSGRLKPELLRNLTTGADARQLSIQDIAEGLRATVDRFVALEQAHG